MYERFSFTAGLLLWLLSSPSFLTSHLQSSSVFIRFRLLVIHLASENREWTKIVVLDSDCAMTVPFAPIVCFTGNSPSQSSLPLSPAYPEICGQSGTGPGGGVQRGGQQGVPLPDKNDFSVPEQHTHHVLCHLVLFSQFGSRFDPRNILFCPLRSRSTPV